MIDDTAENIVGILGLCFFFFSFFLSLFWITYLKMYLRATDCDKKALHSEGFKSDPSSVSTTSIIAAQWCEMMDWLSSDSDMCCHSVIERQQLKLCTAVEDSANIHDTPSDGEVYTCISSDILYVRICPIKQQLTVGFWETLKTGTIYLSILVQLSSNYL